MNVKLDHDGVIPPAMERVFGSRTGMIKQAYYTVPDRRAPVVYLMSPNRCNLEYLVRTDREFNLRVSGKGTDLESAMVSCVGEFLERYALCWPDPDAMTRTSYAELSESHEVADFEYLDQFDEEFRDRNLGTFTRETDLLWTAGVDLLTGEEVYLPAQHVWNHTGVLGSDPVRFLGSSSGVAAGPTLETALLWALYEAIERDGVMQLWWRHETPPSIDVEAEPWLRELEQQLLQDEGLGIALFECEPQVDVPTYFGALVNERDEYPKFLAAGETNLDVRSALAGAAVECCQGWPYIYESAATYDVEMDITEVTDDFTENMVFYANPDNFEHVSFLFDGPSTRPRTGTSPDVTDWSVERQLHRVLDLLDDAGCTPIAFDLTTDDVRECGVHVARVFVPEFVRLTIPGAPPMAHPVFEDDDIVEKPHPFP